MYFYTFLIFTNLAVLFGLVLITFSNPMHSILSLVGCIFCSVLILFIFGIEFVAFMYLVVYIGAIAILFLFIIVMLNLNSINSLPRASVISSIFLYLCIFFKTTHALFLTNVNIFLLYLDLNPVALFDSSHSYVWKAPLRFNHVSHTSADLEEGYCPNLTQGFFLDNYPDLLILGLDAPYELPAFCTLYNTHFLYFILAGGLLLFALLGAISLCTVK
jgi:NADH:ubiquinone oxidoreductase subunit 6 (subunit J)